MDSNSSTVKLVGRVNCGPFFGSGPAGCSGSSGMTSSGLMPGNPKFGRSRSSELGEESEEAAFMRGVPGVEGGLKSGEVCMDMSVSANLQRASCEGTEVGLKNPNKAKLVWLTR
jgi:hypothetical protein